ncbi:protein translocase subunit SecD [Deferribacterales bacterium Es71-Z0220]|uniref:protein translocase subunit SecD n=1 Tax=Deferrivibrio essentukiensis TaxID=2880922 RepID=UPI001F6131E8|nr:protein translocase subunit SecD [Deferrivibrio essentukiensis]MCB4204056.1 protein translocase subunit SecD [Deferrivibrio essentukiensis]
MKYKFRWATIAAIVIAALVMMLPLKEKIKLGLDLQGGMHVVLGVETEKAVDGKLDTIVTQLKKELKNANIKYSFAQKTKDGKIKLGFQEASLTDKARDLITKNYPYLVDSSLSNDPEILVFSLDQKEYDKIKDYAVEQAVQVIRNRIDQFGVSEPVIQRQGKNEILVQLPGITDPDRAIDLIGKTAQLRFHIVDENVSTQDAINGNLPFDDILLYSKEYDKVTGKLKQEIPYVLKREAVLTGEYLTDAEVRISSQFNEPYVLIKFDSAGSKLFDQITAENVNKRLAIVLDNNVYSAPVIRERISGGEAQISGNFTMDEAKDLAIVLRAGSLPAPVVVLENRTVGPSLGFDSITKGVKAAVIGFLAVMIFILFYYRVSGVIANIALLLNFILILGVMSAFGATLTLPGIAGIILTIGMSVDANVLIFERIREELRIGRTPLNAIEAGYEKAMSTILDANITTLIAALVLFQFGTGPIKGFAVTLSIGILSSMFTAIFVTRTIFMTFFGGKDTKNLSI